MIIATAQVPETLYNGCIDPEQIIWEAPQAGGPVVLEIVPSNVEPGELDLVARFIDPEDGISVHIAAHEMEAPRPHWVARIPECFLPRPKETCAECNGAGAVESIRIVGWAHEREETVEEHTVSVCFCCLPGEPKAPVEWPDDEAIPF